MKHYSAILGKVESIRAAMEGARATFYRYRDLHAAKPDMDKAKANEIEGDAIDVALSELRELERFVDSTMMIEGDEKVAARDNTILDVVEQIRGADFKKELLEYIEECDGGHSFAITSSREGTRQENDRGVAPSIKSEWVNQTTNGGFTGDEFAGDVYVHLKFNLYFRFSYSC